MQKAPPEVHAGIESTAPNGNAPASGIAGRFTRLASDVADKLTGDGDADAPAYEDMSNEELLELAREADIEGRSNMDKGRAHPHVALTADAVGHATAVEARSARCRR